MTPLAIAAAPAALVFDQMASDYDEVFTNSMIGRAQREAVWNKLTQTFQCGDLTSPSSRPALRPELG